MARMKKDELIEEARGLGLDVSDEDHYDEILAAVKDAREAPEDESEDEEGYEYEVPVEAEPVPIEDEPDPLESPESLPRKGWSKLGVWQGGGRPR